MIIFSGTSYLGLDRYPAFLALIHEGLKHYGSHYGGSRRSPLTPTIFREVEQAIAEWTGAPAALLLSSGTAAGQLLVRYMAMHQQHTLHYSPTAHPALHWPNGVLHKNWGSWQAAANDLNNTCLTDSVNPLQLSWPHWEKANNSTSAQLIIDDSHLIGHYGPQASGSWRLLQPKWGGEFFITASLGKALCIPAGVLLGSADAIEALKALPQFGGASPPAPAYLYAWLKAGAILSEQRHKLAIYIQQVKDTIGADDRFQTLENFPVIGLHDHSWVDKLAQQGIAISSFRYPGPQDQRYSRIVITAGHAQQEVDYLCECLRELI